MAVLSKRRIIPPEQRVPSALRRGDQAPVYITAEAVRARYGGMSARWLHRAVRYHGFPKPVRLVGTRKHFLLSAVEAWERLRESAA